MHSKNQGFAHRPEAHPPVQLPDDPLFLFIGPGETRVKYVATLVLGFIIDLGPVSRNGRVLERVRSQDDIVLGPGRLARLKSSELFLLGINILGRSQCLLIGGDNYRLIQGSHAALCYCRRVAVVGEGSTTKSKSVVLIRRCFGIMHRRSY